MTVTITVLQDDLFFSDTELHGATRIIELNNIINIFRPEPGSGHIIIKPQINADERRYIEPPSAFICVHPRLISIIHHCMEVPA